MSFTGEKALQCHYRPNGQQTIITTTTTTITVTITISITREL